MDEYGELRVLAVLGTHFWTTRQGVVQGRGLLELLKNIGGGPQDDETGQTARKTLASESYLLILICNHLASQGWELTAVSVGNVYSVYFFKKGLRQ